jgi:predicted nucleotidyltransferase
VNQLIELKRAEIERLCARHGVRDLWLIGSAAGDRFDEKTSDLDFLVEFLPLPSGMVADAYFGLLEDLEGLFERHIDLVMRSAVKNPFFLNSIQRSQVLLYAA